MTSDDEFWRAFAQQKFEMWKLHKILFARYMKEHFNEDVGDEWRGVRTPQEAVEFIMRGKNDLR